MEANQHNQPRLPVEFAGPLLRCSGCGYDLRGLASEGRCPECDRPIPWSSKDTTRRVNKPETPVHAAQGVICVRCGVGLGGYSSHAGCPTCGAPVWLSLDGDWLCVRGPVWLHRQRHAVALWIWALLIPVLLNVVPFVLPWLWGASGFRGYVSEEQFFTYSGVASAIVGEFARLLEWSAAFLLTVANPASIASEPKRTLRRLIRVLVLADSAHEVLGWWQYWLAPEPVKGLNLPLALFGGGVNAALCVSMIAYARRLCHRLPNAKLVRGLTLIFWGFTAFWIVDLLRRGIWALLGDDVLALRDRGWGWLVLYAAPALVGLALLLVFNISLAVVLARFRRELREIVAPGM